MGGLLEAVIPYHQNFAFVTEPERARERARMRESARRESIRKGQILALQGMSCVPDAGANGGREETEKGGWRKRERGRF